MHNIGAFLGTNLTLNMGGEEGFLVKNLTHNMGALLGTNLTLNMGWGPFR